MIEGEWEARMSTSLVRVLFIMTLRGLGMVPERYPREKREKEPRGRGRMERCCLGNEVEGGQDRNLIRFVSDV
jgi:hypothetical protein